MSYRASCQVLALVLIAIGAQALPALAGSPRITFTGTETPRTPPDFSGAIPLGGSLYLLGITEIADDASTDPRITGTSTNVIYGILSPADVPGVFTGPMWGTITIENAGGAWTGPWQGQIALEGTDVVSTGGGTLVGSGDYAGLISVWSLRSVNFGPRQATGYIAKAKVNQRPMKLKDAVSIVKVDMDNTHWTWLAPNMAVIPWTMESTGVGTHLGEFEGTFSGGTLFEFQTDGSMVTIAQWSDGEIIAANGDKLLLFQWPNLQNQTDGYATIRGGTGRFANASGSMTATHQITDRWAEGSFRFIVYVGSYEGTITY